MGSGTRNRAVRAGGAVVLGSSAGDLDRSKSSSPHFAGTDSSTERRLAQLENEMLFVRSMLANQQPPQSGQSLPPSIQQQHPSNSRTYPPIPAVPSYLSPQPPPWQHMTSSTSQAPSPSSPASLAAVEDEVSRRMTVAHNASLLLNPGPSPNVNSAQYQNSHLKRVADGFGQEREGGEASRKRGRAAEAVDDFITRGEIAEDEAVLCFDSYFATLNSPPNPNVPEIHLSFQATRIKSPLLLSVLVTIGARAISHTTSYQNGFLEATRLARLTLLSTGGSSSHIYDAKALVILSLYHASMHLCGHVASMITETHSTALWRLKALGPAKQGTEEAKRLVLQGRTFLITWVWSELYTVCVWKAPAFSHPLEVIVEQVRLLRASPFTESTIDILIEAHCDLVAFAHRAFLALDPSQRLYPSTLHDTMDVISDLIGELQDWTDRRAKIQDLINGWGERQEVRQIMPFHHIRMVLDHYVLRALNAAERSTFPPSAREFVSLAAMSAQQVVSFGTQTKAWLNHASAAQYWTHLKVPAALRSLFTATRLFPEDANWSQIRSLLRAVKAYLDRSASPLATARETALDEEVRKLVSDFSTYVDATTQGDSTNDEAVFEESNEGWMGTDQLQKSLESLRLDTAIWGAMLHELEDVLAG